MYTVILGLGSNEGDSVQLFKRAIRDLSGAMNGITCSSYYKTKPRDYENQDDFFNMVVLGNFSGGPRQLLSIIHLIEARYGRDRKMEIPKGPRTLDIDIELFGDVCLHEPDLVIPHPQLRYRQFVLIPLLEICPECADPETGEFFRDINSRLPDQGVIKAGILYGN